jgi:hypothetical protein
VKVVSTAALCNYNFQVVGLAWYVLIWCGGGANQTLEYCCEERVDFLPSWEALLIKSMKFRYFISKTTWVLIATRMLWVFIQEYLQTLSWVSNSHISSGVICATCTSIFNCPSPPTLTYFPKCYILSILWYCNCPSM